MEQMSCTMEQCKDLIAAVETAVNLPFVEGLLSAPADKLAEAGFLVPAEAVGNIFTQAQKAVNESFSRTQVRRRTRRWPFCREALSRAQPLDARCHQASACLFPG